MGHGQRDYILLTEAELRLCTGDTLTVCPANMAIYDVRTKTCESSLIFQAPDSHSVCRKRVLIAYDTPNLQRHGDTWVYSLPTPQLVTLRCWKNVVWTRRTVSLYGIGLVANAAGCSISAGALHTFPELQGTSQAKLDAPRFHLSDKFHGDAKVQPSVAAESPAELTQLDDVISQLQAHRQTLDADSLLHVHQTSLQHAQLTHLYLIIIATLCTVAVLGFL
jgi:hypothetical protein